MTCCKQEKWGMESMDNFSLTTFYISNESITWSQCKKFKKHALFSWLFPRSSSTLLLILVLPIVGSHSCHTCCNFPHVLFRSTLPPPSACQGRVRLQSTCLARRERKERWGLRMRQSGWPWDRDCDAPSPTRPSLRLVISRDDSDEMKIRIQSHHTLNIEQSVWSRGKAGFIQSVYRPYHDHATSYNTVSSRPCRPCSSGTLSRIPNEQHAVHQIRSKY